MKLSFILELLLVFVLVSFAASRNIERYPKLILSSELYRQNEEDNTIIDEPLSNAVNPLTELPITEDEEDIIEEESSGAEETNVAPIVETETNDGTDAPVNVDDRPAINKYCSCSNAVCNCCRDFSIPIVPVRGPGCAEIKYLKNDRLSVTVKYGDFILANRVVKAGTSKPICIPLPGGFSRFCGRIYGVQRVNEDFKACLGLELRADDEVEASLKVSCFKFGERGLAVTEADPLPAIENEATTDDDDDDDLFGLGGGDGGDDDDDDDEDDEDSSAGGGDDDDDDLFGLGGDDDDDDDDESGASDDSPDYSGFSLISDGFDGIFGDDDDGQKKKKVVIKTKNSNGSIEAIKNTTLTDEHKNDKDAIAALTAAEKPITEATVVVTPTKPKKKKPSGGILDALLGDDDDDDDDDDEKDDDDDADDDEDDDEDDDGEDDETDKEEETTEPEDENKDESEDDKETDATENVEDDDNEEEEEEEEAAEDDYDVASNETDDSQKVTSTDKNKNKKKNDYYGYLSRLMKIF